MRELARRTGAFALALAALTAFASPTLAGESIGLAVTWFQPAFHYGDGDCPDGLNKEQDWKQVFAKQGRSQEEIDKLISHPGSPEFEKAALNRGPHGENVCLRPDVAPDPMIKTVKGKLAEGFNLDGTTTGAATPKSCKHTKFTSPDGAAGIDNQLYRAMGCITSYRGKGHDAFVLNYINERMRSEGMRTFLIEITGATEGSATKGGDVKIGIYVGADPLVQDSAGGVKAHTTQRINRDPRWHNVVNGKMKDGVITTDTFDLNLLGDPLWIPEFNFKSAKLRLVVGADGKVTGTLGGYLDLPNTIFMAVKSGLLYETFGGGNCPGTYHAIKKMADGFPDPVTGECTAISTAFNIETVPAFIVHPPQTDQTANAADSK